MRVKLPDGNDDLIRRGKDTRDVQTTDKIPREDTASRWPSA